MAKKGLILGIILTTVGFVLSFVAFLWFAAIGSQLLVRSYWFAAGTATATADYDFWLIGTVTPNEISSALEQSNFTL